MTTVAVCVVILGLIVVDLLATRFGADTRPPVGQLPDRWFGRR
jgi:hypothetical protein